MSSFSLELQVRACQELVTKHMPKRGIFIRATLFAEVASALLFIQVGLFTHPAMIAVPFFIMALVAMQRVNYARGKNQHVSCDPRGFLLSLITPQNYSMFGLRTRQQGTKVFVWPMMLVHLVCAIVIQQVLFGSCNWLAGNPYLSKQPCDEVPGMLKDGCERHAFEQLKYRDCVRFAWFPGGCNGRFLFCSLISETMNLGRFLTLLYVLAPLAGFFIVLPLRLGGCLTGMMSVPENKGLKRAITARARQLEQELQSGKLQSSLWWDRRAFEFKIGFAAVDVILDAGSCINFILADRYIFAACQLVIIVVSSYIQLRKVGSKLYSAIQESWKVGLASNEVHAYLVEEKTFEAPLSLFFQFGTAFYLSDNPLAFAILLCSILTSLGGIANGLHIANHLSFVDIEEVDLDLCHSPQAVIFNAGFPQPESNSPQNGHPAPQAGLQPTQLPPPPGLQPTQLPPPPGLPRTQLPPPPGLQPNKRRPGQFASDTE